ncbi:MAG: hypothetical protein IKG37_01520 [Solobacterium sp.]|jgi:hypothetical protein|nr:hypothetical protein [Solobacterium sp.]
MKFVEERALRDAFWKKYGNRPNIIAHQFECAARHGGVDLLTVEKVKNRSGKGSILQIVSFEFKLDDIEKAVSQAVQDLEFSHKAFIVIPDRKVKVIEDKYTDEIRKCRYIGVITVGLDGRWDLPIRCWAKSDKDVKLNQEIMKMISKCAGSVI